MKVSFKLYKSKIFKIYIYRTQEDVCRLYASTTPFYVRLGHLWILGSVGSWNYLPVDTEEQLGYLSALSTGLFRLQSCVAGSVSMCSSPVFPARLKPLLGEGLGPAPPYPSAACRVWGCSTTRGNSSPSPSFNVLSANGGWYAVYCLVTRVMWDDALGPSSESAEPGLWEAANLCWWYYRGLPCRTIQRDTALFSPIMEF